MASIKLITLDLETVFCLGLLQFHCFPSWYIKSEELRVVFFLVRMRGVEESSWCLLGALKDRPGSTTCSRWIEACSTSNLECAGRGFQRRLEKVCNMCLHIIWEKFPFWAFLKGAIGWLPLNLGMTDSQWKLVRFASYFCFSFPYTRSFMSPNHWVVITLISMFLE